MHKNRRDIILRSFTNKKYKKPNVKSIIKSNWRGEQLGIDSRKGKYFSTTDQINKIYGCRKHC